MMASSIDDLTDAIREAGFESNVEFFLDNANDDAICELIDTGSVRVEVGERTFLLSLNISEEGESE